jgi:Mg-chelatase subunit ChlD
VVTVVGGVHHFFNEAYDERNGDSLVTARRDDVQLVGSTKELLHVKRRLASGRAGGLGANAGEESGRC